MYWFFSGVPFFIGIRRKQLFLYPARPHIPATNKNIISPLGMSIAQEHDNPDPFDNPDTHYAMIIKIPNDNDNDHDNLDVYPMISSIRCETRMRRKRKKRGRMPRRRRMRRRMRRMRRLGRRWRRRGRGREWGRRRGSLRGNKPAGLQSQSIPWCKEFDVGCFYC